MDSKELNHPNTLWYATYDEECSNKTLGQINFPTYIAIVRTDSHFEQFQQNILNKTSSWSNKATSVYAILDLFNEFFDPEKIDSRMLYVEDKQKRKMVVDFQMWILCERLYALLFYSLDSQDFTDDRCMATLTRVIKFFTAFFSCYRKNMFEEGAFKNFIQKIRQELTSLQKNQSNRWATIMCNNMVSLIAKFISGEPIESNDYKGQAFFILIKEIYDKNSDNIGEIENRLFRAHDKKQTMLKSNESKRWDNIDSLDRIIETIKKIYDPKEMLELEKISKEKALKKPVRALVTVPAPKEAEGKSEMTKYQRNSTGTKFPYKRVINKSDNNPVSKVNMLYNTFIHDLVIPEDKKKEKEESDQEAKEDIDNYVFYTEDFHASLKGMRKDHAKVTKADIIEDIEVQEEVRTKEEKALGKVTDGVWIYYDSDEEYWHTGEVYGTIELESKKHAKMFLLDSDDELDEKRPSFRKFVNQQIEVEREREEKYNDQERLFNITQQTFQKRKSGWYVIQNLYNNMRIHKQLEDVIGLRQTSYFVYPWNPDNNKRKSTIL